MAASLRQQNRAGEQTTFTGLLSLEEIMGQRIKGQEVEVLIISDGRPQQALFDIRSFEITFQMEIKSEGYLGETSNRRDSIFNGVQGRMEAHVETQEFLRFFVDLINKARRRTPGAQINIKATLNFPNGDRPRILIPNCEFGNLPLNFGSRSDYGSVSLDFEAESATVIA